MKIDSIEGILLITMATLLLCIIISILFTFRFKVAEYGKAYVFFRLGKKIQDAIVTERFFG